MRRMNKQAPLPMESNRPGLGRPLALSMGDPCGIGPEIIALAARRGELQDTVVVGDLSILRRAAAWVGGAPVLVLDRADDAVAAPKGCIPLWSPPELEPGLLSLPVGQVHAAAGRAAAQCIRSAARLVQDGQCSALVTAPIHKEALAAAQEPYPGHTELLQEVAGGVPVRMMLANRELRTVLVTIHLSLRQAIEAVTREAVLQTLQITDTSLRRMGIPAPRLGVAGLNPHAGEGGRFGREEVDIIGPAVNDARQAGIDARGPYPGDTVFMRARQVPGHPGEFDAVIAMYHDQGLIPVKYLGVDEGVNVTLGLPFVRTSPDHGTAFDLAGSGQARADSLIAALHMARTLAGG